MQDSLALVDLYDTADGSHWTNHTNWLTSAPISSWYGITVSNNRVVKINFLNNNLKHYLPSSIGNLTGLQSLSIIENYYGPDAGVLPTSISNLINLKTLILRDCGYFGVLPTSFSSLINLDTLDLSLNRLTNEILPTLDNIVGLKYLDLSYNNFSGSIPKSIGNLYQLKLLKLMGNELTGNIPKSLGNLSNLQILYLSNNSLSGKIPVELGQLSNLYELNLSYNFFSGKIPATFGNLLQLKTLIVYSNKLKGLIPPSLQNLSNLETLDLSFNDFEGSVPEWLSNLSNIKDISLEDDFVVRDSVPASFNKFKNLLGINLGEDSLIGKFPDFIKNNHGIKSIVLRGNYFNGTIPTWIGNLVSLAVISLQNNKLEGVIPTQLGNCKGLYVLQLSGNHFESPIPHSISTFTQLLHVSNLVTFYDNKFTFDGMEDIAQAYPFSTYSPQANIHIIQTGNKLTVNVGGTLNNNTYKWYKDGVLKKDVTGNNSFTTNGPGKYNVVVTNSVANQLTLFSDTLIIPAFSKENNSIYFSGNNFIYPNPASKIVHVNLSEPATDNSYCTIYNTEGKALIQKQLEFGVTTAELSITKIPSGNYKLVVWENNRLAKEVNFVVIK